MGRPCRDEAIVRGMGGEVKGNFSEESGGGG